MYSEVATAAIKNLQKSLKKKGKGKTKIGKVMKNAAQMLKKRRNEKDFKN